MSRPGRRSCISVHCKGYKDSWRIVSRMDSIYITSFQINKSKFLVDVETLVIINIYKLAANKNTKLKIKLTDDCSNLKITVDLSQVSYEIVSDWLDYANLCIWPVIIQDNYVIAGLCSVARQIIKHSDNKNIRELLGFRDACLMSCSETSIWTKFCEVDMITTIKQILQNPLSLFDDTTFLLPQDLSRFEFHMSQPIRVHNVYKIAREQSKNKSIKSSVPIEDLDLHHTYAEGPFMTLSDVILFILIELFFEVVKPQNLFEKLPLTISWFNILQKKLLTKIPFETTPLQLKISKILEPQFMKQSLYTTDPARYKPEKRIFTKQKDITNSLRIINNNHIDIANALYPYGEEADFDWSKIPFEANPMSGALPETRAYRKCHQLENLAKSVLKLVQNKKCRIIDFCSGSGHLGILLAYLLPECEIILIENKEMSLLRAKERIRVMELKNVIILQSNLDYFIGAFDIGVSLHACGVATDLVIQNCIKNKAHFVCCPCCYGGIHDCYHLTYPRSTEYQHLNMDYKDYLTLAHAADQTHDPNNRKTTQGFVCMDAIDTDRRLYAESCGYQVHLGKLQPFSCTNKNNLLVGIYNS